LELFVFTQRTNFPTYRLKALMGLPKAAASQAELFATLETVIFPRGKKSPGIRFRSRRENQVKRKVALCLDLLSKNFALFLKT